VLALKGKRVGWLVSPKYSDSKPALHVSSPHISAKHIHRIFEITMIDGDYIGGTWNLAMGVT
jgi:hypothetical protein